MEMTRIRSVKWWQFHHSLWRHKFVVASIMVLGVFLTVVYTSRIPKQYRATSTDFVDTISTANVQDYGSSANDLSRAHKVLAESTKVRLKACQMSTLPMGECDLAAFEARVDGVLIYLSVTHGSYEVARHLANAWSDAFRSEIEERVRFGGEREKEGYDKELGVYQKQLVELQEKKGKLLEDTKFDPTHFATDPIHAIVNFYEDKVRQADHEITNLDEELALVSDKEKTPAEIAALDHVTKNSIFQTRLQRVFDLEDALVQARIKYKEGPELKEAELQLSYAKSQLEHARDEVIVQMKLHRAILQNQHDKDKADYIKNNQQLDLEKKYMAQYSNMQDTIESIKRSFGIVNDHKREAMLAQRSSRNNVVEWEMAQAIDDPVPVRPNWRQNITMGIIISFLLACALVFGLEQIDDTVRTAKDLEQRLGATVLGAVPACGRVSMDREGYFLAKRQSASIAVDSMRGIHIGLEVGRKSAAQNGAMVITVTSAVPQDGKSFVASNLGILFASLGRKVLVVDADLRKASLSKALGADDRNGFFEIVKNQKWTRDFAVNGKTPGYYLLAAGHIHDSSSESLHPDSIVRLIDQMRKDYDVIIFDTPPVLALPDACVLGQVSDVTVLVTRGRHTRMAQIERAASSLYAAKVKELVFVVNGVEAADAAAETYSDGYGYGYGYGKGYGYGQADKAKASAKAKLASSRKGSSDEDEDDE